jgi:hypothetical protein
MTFISNSDSHSFKIPEPVSIVKEGQMMNGGMKSRAPSACPAQLSGEKSANLRTQELVKESVKESREILSKL